MFQIRFAPASDAPPATYSSVEEVFERIQGVASDDIVSKVQAVYLFKVDGKTKQMNARQKLIGFGLGFCKKQSFTSFEGFRPSSDPHFL